MNHEATVKRYYELVDEGAYDELVELFAEESATSGPDGPQSRAAMRCGSSTRRGGRWRTAATNSSRWSPTARRSRFGAAPLAARTANRVAFAWADFHEFDGDRIARRYTFTDRDEV